MSFKYLRVLVTENSGIKSETKTRITAGNWCHRALIKVLISTAVSRKTKLTIYRTVIRSVVMYGSQVWTLSKSDDNTLAIWETKVLREIFGPVKKMAYEGSAPIKS